jgi:DNA-binding NarL/FixJ family response regulator
MDVLVGLEGRELELARAALQAAGSRTVRAVSTVKDYLGACVQGEPDVGLLGFALGARPTLELLRTIRRGHYGANRFMPVLFAIANPDSRAVQIALKARAHEVLALPTTAGIVQALVHRAVFVGRPFVETASYIGPCRRRKGMPWLKEERRVVWAGYVHAAPLEFERG